MDKLNLKTLLVMINNMIMRNRVAYKDYLGEESVTTITLLCSGTITEDHVASNGDLTIIQAPLAIKDPKFSRFVLGEEYDVTFDNETLKMTAYSLRGLTILGTVPASITSVEEIPDNAWFITVESSGAVLLQKGTSLLNKNVSVSQSKTVTKKKYDIKKIPEYLLPDIIAKKLASAQSTANSAQSTANSAQSTANSAKTTANNCVQYSTLQELSDSYKKIARKNIGAASTDYEELVNRPFSLASTLCAKKAVDTAIGSVFIYSKSSATITQVILDPSKTYGFNIETNEEDTASIELYNVKTGTVTLTNNTSFPFFYIGNIGLLKGLSSLELRDALRVSSGVDTILVDGGTSLIDTGEKYLCTVINEVHSSGSAEYRSNKCGIISSESGEVAIYDVTLKKINKMYIPYSITCFSGSFESESDEYGALKTENGLATITAQKAYEAFINGPVRLKTSSNAYTDVVQMQWYDSNGTSTDSSDIVTVVYYTVTSKYFAGILPAT